MASVQEALNTLTPRDREILLLWDAGLSYPEIAAQTGLAVGAVGTTLARARRRLVDAHDRQQTDETGDRCGTFLRTSCTPIWTRR